MDEAKKKMAAQFGTIVQRGLYKEADEMLTELREEVNPEKYLSEDLCITAAFLYNKLGNRENELYYLNKGFLINPRSSSLFVSLGDYYSKVNTAQELICLYQAEYYAKKNGEMDQASFIKKIIDSLENGGITVPKTSIVILSFNTKDYLRQCLDSIKETIPLDRCQVIVVDNASTDGSLDYLKSLDWITLIENHENRGFPGGCNDGINAAEKDNDIYLLNSDTILPANALFWLKMGLYESDKVGSTGSITNYAANGQAVDVKANSVEEFIQFGEQVNIPGAFPYAFKPFLIGFSLLLKRTTLDIVGLLDERFNPGNSEDLDLGLRILKEEKLNLLCMNSFVFHYGNRSFAELLKSGQDYDDLLKKNCQKLIDKIGFDITRYFKDSLKIVDEIRAKRGTSLHILEVGSGIGTQAAVIRTKYPNAEYKGVEPNQTLASYAKAFGEILTGDLETTEFGEKYEGYFDYIILSDVLQFIHNPGKYLRSISKYLKKNGRLIISIPNIRYYEIIISLLADDRFTYSDDGIIKNGTVRFYTENEAARLISGSGYSIKNIKSVIGKKPSVEEEKYINNLSELFDQPDTDDLLALEYIFTAETIL